MRGKETLRISNSTYKQLRIFKTQFFSRKQWRIFCPSTPGPSTYFILIWHLKMWFLLSKGTLQVAFPSSMFRIEAHMEIGPAACLPWTRVLTFSRFSRVWLFATPRPLAHQAPLSMGLSRQEYWSGLLCRPPGNLPDPGIEPSSPTLQADSLPTEAPGKPALNSVHYY